MVVNPPAYVPITFIPPLPLIPSLAANAQQRGQPIPRRLCRRRQIRPRKPPLRPRPRRPRRPQHHRHPHPVALGCSRHGLRGRCPAYYGCGRRGRHHGGQCGVLGRDGHGWCGRGGHDEREGVRGRGECDEHGGGSACDGHGCVGWRGGCGDGGAAVECGRWGRRGVILSREKSCSWDGPNVIHGVVRAHWAAALARRVVARGRCWGWMGSGGMAWRCAGGCTSATLP